MLDTVSFIFSNFLHDFLEGGENTQYTFYIPNSRKCPKVCPMSAVIHPPYPHAAFSSFTINLPTYAMKEKSQHGALLNMLHLLGIFQEEGKEEKKVQTTIYHQTPQRDPRKRKIIHFAQHFIYYFTYSCSFLLYAIQIQSKVKVKYSVTSLPYIQRYKVQYCSGRYTIYTLKLILYSVPKESFCVSILCVDLFSSFSPLFMLLLLFISWSWCFKGETIYFSFQLSTFLTHLSSVVGCVKLSNEATFFGVPYSTLLSLLLLSFVCQNINNNYHPEGKIRSTTYGIQMCCRNLVGIGIALVVAVVATNHR